jgi:hypothetical protein
LLILVGEELWRAGYRVARRSAAPVDESTRHEISRPIPRSTFRSASKYSKIHFWWSEQPELAQKPGLNAR